MATIHVLPYAIFVMAGYAPIPGVRVGGQDFDILVLDRGAGRQATEERAQIIAAALRAHEEP